MVKNSKFEKPTELIKFAHKGKRDDRIIKSKRNLDNIKPKPYKKKWQK